MKVKFSQNYFAASGALYVKHEEYDIPSEMADVLPVGTTIDGVVKKVPGKVQKAAPAPKPRPVEFTDKKKD